MRHLGKRVLDFVQNFLKKEDGPTAVEYAVILALVIIVCFVTIGTLGKTTQSTFNAPKLVSALQSS